MRYTETHQNITKNLNQYKNTLGCWVFVNAGVFPKMWWLFTFDTYVIGSPSLLKISCYRQGVGLDDLVGMNL